MTERTKASEKFKFLEHMADIKFQAYGNTLDEVFENIVLAFSDYASSGRKIKSVKGRIKNISGNDQESLLYNFLDELIYLLDAENFIVSKAKVLLRGNNLQAEFFGDDIKNYELKHIKAATYAEMHIKKNKDRWEAQIVLDV